MRLLFAAAVFASVLAGSVLVEAQSAPKVAVQIHHEKKVPRTGVRVKFVELIEDSRCPVDTNCVWAGNARIRVKVMKNGRTETFELNTNAADKDATFAGYRFKLTKLDPELRTNIRVNRNGYVATIEMSKIK